MLWIASLAVALAVGFAVALIQALSGQSVVQYLTIGLVTTVVVAILAFALASRALQSRLPVIDVQWRRSPPNVEVSATSGPSTDIRVHVTNRGPQAEFYATAALVGVRHPSNPLHRGSYAVPWLGHDRTGIPLATGQGHALVVARFQLMTFLNPPPLTRMGQADIIELKGQHEAVWDSFRWIIDPKLPLTEFDLDVTLTCTAAAKPLVLRYTLRPSEWLGPLELVTRAPADDK